MASTFGPRLIGRSTPSVPGARSLGRRMTFHAAAALLVFAALQVWLVSSAIAAGAPSAFIVVALVILLALGVPAAPITERRGDPPSRPALARGGLHASFRRARRRRGVGAPPRPLLL